MKDIDELISNITLKDEDYADIDPIPLDEAAYKNIVSATLKEIHKASLEDKKVKKKRKHQLLLIAAVLMVSTTLFAGAKALDIGEIFYNIFGKYTANIGSSGQVINNSVTCEGIEMNLEGVVNDENIVEVVFGLHKTSGEPFIGEHIDFDDFDVITTKGSSKTGEGGITESRFCQEIETVYTDLNTRRFRMTLTKNEAIQNGEAALRIENINENKNYTYTSHLDLATWLKAHPQEITLNPNNDFRLKHVTDKAQIKALHIPEQVIISESAQLQLFKEDHNIEMTSIAFVNDKLHMKIENVDYKNCISDIYFKDKHGRKYAASYQCNTGSTSYYVFDIASMEALEGLKVCGDLKKVIHKINGLWEIKFDLNAQNEKLIVQPDIKVPIGEAGDIEVKEIQVSNISLKLKSSKLSDNKLKDLVVKIKFKNEDTLLPLKEVRVHTYTGNNNHIIYNIDQLINIQNIEAIIINDQVIEINKS